MELNVGQTKRLSISQYAGGRITPSPTFSIIQISPLVVIYIGSKGRYPTSGPRALYQYAIWCTCYVLRAAFSCYRGWGLILWRSSYGFYLFILGSLEYSSVRSSTFEVALRPRSKLRNKISFYLKQPIFLMNTTYFWLFCFWLFSNKVPLAFNVTGHVSTWKASY